MFKFVTVAVLAAVGVAQSATDEPAPAFPNIDNGINGCRLSVHYPGRKCGALFDRFNVMIDAFSNEDPAEGHYKDRVSSFFTKHWTTAKRVN